MGYGLLMAALCFAVTYKITDTGGRAWILGTLLAGVLIGWFMAVSDGVDGSVMPVLVGMVVGSVAGDLYRRHNVVW